MDLSSVSSDRPFAGGLVDKKLCFLESDGFIRAQRVEHDIQQMLHKTQAHWTRDRALRKGLPLDVVLQMVRSEDIGVRKDAIMCLARIAPFNHGESISILMHSLADSQDAVKLAALHSLKQVADRDDPDVIVMLSEKTFHLEPKVRLIAIKALGVIAERGNFKAIEVLSAHAQPNEEELWQVRLAALQQLAALAPDHDWVALGVFTACLRDCLMNINGHGVEEMAQVAISALAHLAPEDVPDVVDSICACTRCEHPSLQCMALEALPQVVSHGHATALDAVIACVAAEIGLAWDVRKTAVASLLQLAPRNHKESVISLRQCLAQSSDDGVFKHATFRAIASAVSAWRHDKDGWKTLIASLEHADWRLRKHALLVLISSIHGDQRYAMLRFLRRLLHEDIAKALALVMRRCPENFNVEDICGHSSVIRLLTRQDQELKAIARAALEVLAPDGIHEAFFPTAVLPEIERVKGPSLEVDGRWSPIMLEKSGRQAFRREVPMRSRDQYLFGAPNAIFYPREDWV